MGAAIQTGARGTTNQLGTSDLLIATTHTNRLHAKTACSQAQNRWVHNHKVPVCQLPKPGRKKHDSHSWHFSRQCCTSPSHLLPQGHHCQDLTLETEAALSPGDVSAWPCLKDTLGAKVSPKPYYSRAHTGACTPANRSYLQTIVLNIFTAKGTQGQ